jgi:adenosyl cobinamide kinase/adenosyl cobinamide phosphate guanylyltransferase
MARSLHSSLVVGPAWSGKTNWTVQQLSGESKVCWLGTMTTQEQELADWIAELKSARPSTWTNVDAPTDLITPLRAQSPFNYPLVIDSLSQWLCNLAFAHHSKHTPPQLLERLMQEFNETFEFIEAQAKHRDLWIVSAEFGATPPAQDATMSILRRVLGLANQRLASFSRSVYQLQCGICQKIK